MFKSFRAGPSRRTIGHVSAYGGRVALFDRICGLCKEPQFESDFWVPSKIPSSSAASRSKALKASGSAARRPVLATRGRQDHARPEGPDPWWLQIARRRSQVFRYVTFHSRPNVGLIFINRFSPRVAAIVYMLGALGCASGRAPSPELKLLK